jgi:exodeoxyribonuclease III
MASTKGEKKKFKIRIIDEEDCKKYLVTSLNVNGLRDEIWYWIKTYLKVERPHVLCLQETKRSEDKLKVIFDQVSKSYKYELNSHTPPHMHGVAILIRKDVNYSLEDVDLKCNTRSDNKSNDSAKGRVLSICVNNLFYVVNTYVPNAGSDRLNPLKNLPYRIKEWDPALRNYLNCLRDNLPTLWIGDINVAPQDIDVTDPKGMGKGRWAGFTKEEKESFQKMLDTKEWFDIWRDQHPDEEAYTWRGRTLKNQMRLDNCVVSKSLVKYVSSSFILSEEDASKDTDHVLLGISFYFKE